VQITANTKGLKKKPGTAPPADLGKAVRMTAQSQNRVELIYVNSQQPVQPKVSAEERSRREIFHWLILNFV
jgi:E3 SUMO-protein ligase PIAS1